MVFVERSLSPDLQNAWRSEAPQYRTLTTRDVEIDHLETKVIWMHVMSKVIAEETIDVEMLRSREADHRQATEDLVNWEKNVFKPATYED